MTNVNDDEDDDGSLASQWWKLQTVKSKIEGGLEDIDCTRIGGDYYDNSIEIYGVPADHRLTQRDSDWLKECGFSKIYVNHTDGWETHYSPGSIYGWRRRYVSDPMATTTNVIAGEPDPGYYETNRFPKGFPEKWLETGYFRVVDDPLTPLSPAEGG
jgi:hypothetical protein